MTSSENCLILVNSDEFNTVDIRKMLIIRWTQSIYKIQENSVAQNLRH